MFFLTFWCIFFIFLGILTPNDEFNYWSELSLSGSADKNRAKHYTEIFQPISRDFSGLDSLAFSDVIELIEITQDTLDDVWKDDEFDPAFPEKRMKHLLNVIGIVS